MEQDFDLESEYELRTHLPDGDGNQVEEENPEDDNMTDAEADADTLASAGMGTDEDYGGTDYSFPEFLDDYFGGEYAD